jgi:hypothetical protein
MSTAAETSAPTKPGAPPAWMRLVTWAIAFGCFYLVYSKIAGAAAREGISALEYLARFLAQANWLAWLGLMVPYSIFFFLVDSFATTKVINWFNARVRYRDILPVRASTYILALVNEQVGKGAMALYLYRRDRFIAFAELYQLLLFSSVGVATHYSLVQAASTELPLATLLPAVFLGAAVYFVVHLAFFSRRILPGWTLRDRPLLLAFRKAKLWQYVALICIKAPNLILAVVVYTLALGFFRVEVAFGTLLAFLPVIFLAAALPLPFHAGALALWAVLFPEFPEVSAFSLVMHTFFVVFNATIGLVFLPRVNRELFGEAAPARAAGPDPV